MEYLRKIHVPDIEDYNVDKQNFGNRFRGFRVLTQTTTAQKTCLRVEKREKTSRYSH